MREFDASAGGLGGCPYAKSATGNLATEDLVWMLDGLGIAHGVDLRAVVRTSRWLADQLGRPSPSRVVAALSSVTRCARFAAEEVGVADIDDFDIDKSIAAAWAEFQVAAQRDHLDDRRVGRSDHRHRAGRRRSLRSCG